MQSSGMDHHTQCRAPGAPDACWLASAHTDFQEILWNDLVANVPYDPFKDIGSVNIPVRAREQKITRWDRHFFICNRTDDEKLSYDRAVAAWDMERRAMERQQKTWWFRALVWIFWRGK